MVIIMVKPMAKKRFPKHVLIIGGLIAGLLLFFLLWQSHRGWVSMQRSKQEVYMTVFVHGSFGSLVGFVNFADVMSDKISGTLYRQINKGMRDDDFFYRDQPILQRGLVRVEPTFDIHLIGNKKYAAYPIIKAYEIINNIAKQNNEKTLFYTFGWSGLISQNSRRFEAIRLYNALSEEVKKLNAQGIYPKIRLLSHSHGGNLCLNLGAVSRALEAKTWNEQQQFSADVDENESIQKTLVLFKELGTQDEAHNKKGQKVYDYVPVYRPLVIDELIMFGTPIQPETEAFCYAPCFKKVFNFYSGEDRVQRADWVSSKKGISSQQVQKNPPKGPHAELYQVKIMAERSFNQPAANYVNDAKTVNTPASPAVKKTELTVIEELLAGRNVFSRSTKDPTHRELWFVSWRSDRSSLATSAGQPEVSLTSFLLPLPMVIITPLLVKVLTQPGIAHNVRLNVRAAKQDMDVDVLPLDSSKSIASIKIPRSYIAEIKEKIKPWKPDDLSWETEFSAVYKHLKLSQLHLRK
jgi:hypothetical protein